MLFSRQTTPTELLASSLYDENSFYKQFMRDLEQCGSEVILESPFVTFRRLTTLLPILEKLKNRKVRITINTRDPAMQENEYMQADTRRALSALQHMGVHVLFTAGHHRKLAILDRRILYEGSLNILSQNNSCEVMRRTESSQLAWQMAHFIKIDQF